MFRAANGESLGNIGMFRAELALNNFSCLTTIHVYRNLAVPLLSKASCIRLNLLEPGWPHCRLRELSIQPGISSDSTPVLPRPANELHVRKQAILEEFPEVFNDEPFRAMKGPPIHIELREDAIPCKHYKPRTIPFHWQAQVKQQLDSMVNSGVIEAVPIGESYAWCHPMVVVPKKDTSKLRITVDLTGLNKYVQRPAYPMRSPREVVASIPR